MRRVRNLGVVLDTTDEIALERSDRRIRGRRGDRRSRRRLGDAVEVAHPHGLFSGQAAKQLAAVAVDGEIGAAVLARFEAIDDTATLLGDQLGAVTDAQDRHAEVIDLGIDFWCTLDIDRRRTAAEDDPRRVLGRVLGRGQIVGDQFAVRVCFANTAGDQLRVLRAKIDNEDRTSLISHECG